MGGAVVVVPILAELSVGDSVLATAHRLSFIAKCFPNAGSVFDWTSQKPELVRITRLRETGTNIAYSKLDGIDQFVYCLDHSTINPPPPFDPQTALDPGTSQEFFITGRQYYQIAVAYNQPPSWNPAYMRQLWLYDLFGEGSLP